MPQVVLIQPQIPPNTGNIARTCAATQTQLHLVGPLGFQLSNRYLKRAGLDYWPHVDLHLHETIQEFQAFQTHLGGRKIGFSTSGKYNYIEFEFQIGDWLIFGQETCGLPSGFIENCHATVYIPISQAYVRSLNLSVSVAIGLFEAHRQLGLL